MLVQVSRVSDNHFFRITTLNLKIADSKPLNIQFVISFPDASVVVNKVLEADDVNFGYDAMNGEYVNMIEQGIIDPTKVISICIKMNKWH